MAVAPRKNQWKGCMLLATGSSHCNYAGPGAHSGRRANSLVYFLSNSEWLSEPLIDIMVGNLVTFTKTAKLALILINFPGHLSLRTGATRDFQFAWQNTPKLVFWQSHWFHSIFSSTGLVGRGAVCYLSRRASGGQEFVIKDYWVLGDVDDADVLDETTMMEAMEGKVPERDPRTKSNEAFDFDRRREMRSETKSNADLDEDTQRYENDPRTNFSSEARLQDDNTIVSCDLHRVDTELTHLALPLADLPQLDHIFLRPGREYQTETFDEAGDNDCQTETFDEAGDNDCQTEKFDEAGDNDCQTETFDEAGDNDCQTETFDEAGDNDCQTETFDEAGDDGCQTVTFDTSCGGTVKR
ncbi:hypothetical protein BD769DRAFT_1391599 [Suillus cothurnatus]|nr:hypothetical protein BD769DRAFT_1391578 [Suillus cothurnatus]KAG2114047.1 hypothetical protein BD769DRAFT_1391599 [Suillus cothurnatus]